MPIVTVSLLKQHTRTDDFADDDDYLGYLLVLSEQVVLAKTGYTEAQIRADHGGDVPAACAHAVLLLAGYWYAQREAAGMSNTTPVPYGISMLIDSVYRSTRAWYDAGGVAPDGCGCNCNSDT